MGKVIFSAFVYHPIHCLSLILILSLTLMPDKKKYNWLITFVDVYILIWWCMFAVITFTMLRLQKVNWQKIPEERAIKGLKKLENEKILRVAPMGFNFFYELFVNNNN